MRNGALMVVASEATWSNGVKEFGIDDVHGQRIGAVLQVSHSRAREVLQRFQSTDLMMAHQLHIVDADGNLELAIGRAPKIDLEGSTSFEHDLAQIVGQGMSGWRMYVYDSAGHEIGQVVQTKRFGKIQYGLRSRGIQCGSLHANDWQGSTLTIRNHIGTDVVAISRIDESLATKLGASANSQIVQIHRPLDDPLRSLAVAAALALVTGFKRESRFIQSRLHKAALMGVCALLVGLVGLGLLAPGGTADSPSTPPPTTVPPPPPPTTLPPPAPSTTVPPPPPTTLPPPAPPTTVPPPPPTTLPPPAPPTTVPPPPPTTLPPPAPPTTL